MSETPLRSRMRSRAASSAKRKRGDESSGIPSDNGDTSMSAQDATDSAEASEKEDEDGEQVVIQTRQSLRQKNKKRKVAKITAKPNESKRAALEGESEDEASPDSSPPSSPKGLKVERPSVVFNRRKREVKKQEAKLKAQKRKITSVPLDVSDSSTDSTAEPHSITPTARKGETFQEGRNRAGRRVERAVNRSVLNRDQEYPPSTASEFKRLIPKPQHNNY